MMTAEARKNKRITKLQKQRLLDIMEEHHLYLYGRFPSSKGAIDKKVKWEEITKDLNKLGHPKSVDQWKRCWTDMKATTKDKAVKIRRHNNKSGNGRSSMKLSAADRKVIMVCNKLHIDGSKDLEEVGIELPRDHNQSKSLEESNRLIKTTSKTNEKSGNQSYEKKNAPATKTSPSSVKPTIINIEKLPTINVTTSHKVTKQQGLIIPRSSDITLQSSRSSFPHSHQNPNSLSNGNVVNNQQVEHDSNSIERFNDRQSSRYGSPSFHVLDERSPARSTPVRASDAIRNKQSFDAQSNNAYFHGREDDEHFEKPQYDRAISQRSRSPSNFRLPSSIERTRRSPRNLKLNSLSSRDGVNTQQEGQARNGSEKFNDRKRSSHESALFHKIYQGSPQARLSVAANHTMTQQQYIDELSNNLYDHKRDNYEQLKERQYDLLTSKRSQSPSAHSTQSNPKRQSKLLSSDPYTKSNPLSSSNGVNSHQEGHDRHNNERFNDRKSSRCGSPSFRILDKRSTAPSTREPANHTIAEKQSFDERSINAYFHGRENDEDFLKPQYDRDTSQRSRSSSVHSTLLNFRPPSSFERTRRSPLNRILNSLPSRNSTEKFSDRKSSPDESPSFHRIYQRSPQAKFSVPANHTMTKQEYNDEFNNNSYDHERDYYKQLKERQYDRVTRQRSRSPSAHSTQSNSKRESKLENSDRYRKSNPYSSRNVVNSHQEGHDRHNNERFNDQKSSRCGSPSFRILDKRSPAPSTRETANHTITKLQYFDELSNSADDEGRNNHERSRRSSTHSTPCNLKRQSRLESTQRSPSQKSKSLSHRSAIECGTMLAKKSRSPRFPLSPSRIQHSDYGEPSYYQSSSFWCNETTYQPKERDYYDKSTSRPRRGTTCSLTGIECAASDLQSGHGFQKLDDPQDNGEQPFKSRVIPSNDNYVAHNPLRTRNTASQNYSHSEVERDENENYINDAQNEEMQANHIVSREERITKHYEGDSREQSRPTNTITGHQLGRSHSQQPLDNNENDTKDSRARNAALFSAAQQGDHIVSEEEGRSSDCEHNEEKSEEPKGRRKTRHQLQNRRPQEPLANLANESIDLQRQAVEQLDVIIEQNRRLIQVTENVLAENTVMIELLRTKV